MKEKQATLTGKTEVVLFLASSWKILQGLLYDLAYDHNFPCNIQFTTEVSESLLLLRMKNSSNKNNLFKDIQLDFGRISLQLQSRFTTVKEKIYHYNF